MASSSGGSGSWSVSFRDGAATWSAYCPPMRWGRLWVASAVLLAACSGGGDRDSGGADDSGTATRASAAPAAGGDLAAGLEDHQIEVTGVEPDPGPGIRLDPEQGVGGIGEALLTVVTDREGEVEQVARSTDLGATWQPVELPGAPDVLDSPRLDRVGHVATVNAGGPDNSVYLWASGDGERWQGGLLPSEVAAARGSGNGQLPDGRPAIVTLDEDGGPERLLTLSDEGEWQTIDCPPEATVELHNGPGCIPPVPMGGGLWLRLNAASLDEGRTWAPIVVTPDPRSDDVPSVASAAPLADGAGWLATVAIERRLQDVPQDLELLVRSVDGLTWETLLADPCTEAGERTASAFFSGPTRLGDSWLVSSTCLDNSEVPLRSVLYLVGPDGTDPQVIAEAPAGDSLGAGIAVGDTVVMPYATDDGTFLHLRP